MSVTSVEVASWEEHRRYLFAVAYRLLGSAAEAEDAVQEAYLRSLTVDVTTVRDPRAWLTTVTSRICLDQLGSARARRESYIGTWLPEPLAAADDLDVGDTVALRESARTAVLLVLENLSPAERVAFVLHDVFGMDFDTLATVVDRSPAACRQLASRARRHVQEEAPPRPRVSAAELAHVTAAFLKASADGDVAALVGLLDPSVVMRSDGGGVVPSARTLHGAQAVLTLLAGLGNKYPGAQVSPVALANGPGFRIDRDSGVVGVVSVEIEGGRITKLDLVVHPEKVRRFR
ncbi:MAG: RNA polymerase sigma factor SigJ [Hamadaea sp.]|nr:RNA polymerase sigma factor SigJ [Hamadaea sp.]